MDIKECIRRLILLQAHLADDVKSASNKEYKDILLEYCEAIKMAEDKLTILVEIDRLIDNTK